MHFMEANIFLTSICKRLHHYIVLSREEEEEWVFCLYIRPIMPSTFLALLYFALESNLLSAPRYCLPAFSHALHHCDLYHSSA